MKGSFIGLRSSLQLVIVESPTKAKTLGRFLGKDYSVMATMGHVRDLPKSTLGVDVEHDFKPEYVVVEGREGTIAAIKAEAKKAARVILATDPDREGEAIAYHTRRLLTDGKKVGEGKYGRIVFHEITPHAVEEALKHVGRIKKDLVHAQAARRVLDRLVGYKLSPLLWRKVRRGLSAGRVQSVAVRLVVEREREIEAFKASEYWVVRVEVQKVQKVQEVSRKASPRGEQEGEEKFWVELWAIEGKQAKPGTFLIQDKARADAVLADLKAAAFRVSSVTRTEVRQNPSPPFMTSTLQRAAATHFGWSSRRTMRSAQGLYEKGLITYHRTDSLSISEVAIKEAAAFIKEKYGAEYGLPQPRRFKSRSRLAQEAHEAIRPTDVARVAGDGNGAGKESGRLYDLIWRRFVASQMAPAVYDRTRVDVEATKPNRVQKVQEVQEVRKVSGVSTIGKGGTTYTLRATGSVMKFDGFMKVYRARGENDSLLPEVQENEVLKREKVTSEQKFTEPPARFNEASLIKALEERGIGRPSTYAPTISTIQSRQYVEKQEQRFYPTAIGVAVTDFLLKYFPKVMDYDFTATVEGDLDEIASGKKDWVKVMRTFYGPFDKNVEEVGDKAKRVKVKTEETGRACPECKEGKEVIRVGRFGKFLSCSRFPECRYTAPFIERVKGVRCPKDGGEIVIRKTRKGKRFYGCKNYPKCDWASWRKPKRGGGVEGDSKIAS
ncbi:MAG: type I DNA topoisomerase [Candidatus Chisholmbacteria bacterium]|nr:type I DNA topoisomerase [Candidatus Chisholmbacteria bacterium]